MKKKKSRRNNKPSVIDRQVEMPPPPAPHPLEQESWVATVRTLPLTKWQFILTAIGLPVAVIGLLLGVASILIPIVMERRSRSDATVTAKEKTVAVSEAGKVDPAPSPSPIVLQNSSAVDSKEAPKTEVDQRKAPANLAARHVANARVFYKQRNYPQALTECDNALRVDPNNKVARAFKAKIQQTRQILADNDKSIQ